MIKDVLKAVESKYEYLVEEGECLEREVLLLIESVTGACEFEPSYEEDIDYDYEIEEIW